MANEDQNPLLLDDAVSLVISNPCAASRWHALHEVYRYVSDPLVRAGACARLEKGVAAAGPAGFFLSTFLGAISGDPAHGAAAAGLALTMQPFDPERCVSLAAIGWGTTLLGCRTRGAFIARLQQLRLAELIQAVAARVTLASAARPAPRAVDVLRRVAIVAPYLGLPSHTPTMLAFRQAAVWRELGMDVRMFAAQEFDIPHQADYFANAAEVVLPRADVAALQSMMARGITLHLADPRYTLARRWNELLMLAGQFDPDLVFFVGLASPLVAPLYEARPLLGLCVNAVAPLVPVDVWLSGERSLHGATTAEWAPALPPARAHFHPFRVVRPPACAPRGRAALGIEAQQLVLVTVGARLPAEIEGDWAARMLSLLQRQPALVWLLVGGEGVLPAALAQAPAGRVRVLAHCDNLREILPCCDICLNPPRMGGGFSVADAMAEGLPVVTLAEGDGGNKAGTHAVADLDAYFARIDALLADPHLRRRSGEQLRAMFAETLDLANSGPSLLQAGEQALAGFRMRRAGAVGVPG